MATTYYKRDGDNMIEWADSSLTKKEMERNSDYAFDDSSGYHIYTIYGLIYLSKLNEHDLGNDGAYIIIHLDRNVNFQDIDKFDNNYAPYRNNWTGFQNVENYILIVDGGGHAIWNLRCSTAQSFSRVFYTGKEESRVTDLKIRRVNIATTQSECCMFYGPFDIYGCQIDGIITDKTPSSSAHISGLGIKSNTIEHCSFCGTLDTTGYAYGLGGRLQEIGLPKKIYNSFVGCIGNHKFKFGNGSSYLIGDTQCFDCFFIGNIDGTANLQIERGADNSKLMLGFNYAYNLSSTLYENNLSGFLVGTSDYKVNQFLYNDTLRSSNNEINNDRQVLEAIGNIVTLADKNYLIQASSFIMPIDGIEPDVNGSFTQQRHLYFSNTRKVKITSMKIKGIRSAHDSGSSTILWGMQGTWSSRAYDDSKVKVVYDWSFSDEDGFILEPGIHESEGTTLNLGISAFIGYNIGNIISNGIRGYCQKEFSFGCEYPLSHGVPEIEIEYELYDDWGIWREDSVNLGLPYIWGGVYDPGVIEYDIYYQDKQPLTLKDEDFPNAAPVLQIYYVNENKEKKPAITISVNEDYLINEN